MLLDRLKTLRQQTALVLQNRRCTNIDREKRNNNYSWIAEHLGAQLNVSSENIFISPYNFDNTPFNQFEHGYIKNRVAYTATYKYENNRITHIKTELFYIS